MDNKQHYLDIAAGQGKKEPSRIVAFPAQPLNYALIEQRLEEQTEYTDGEISYLSDDLDEGFFYHCQHGDDELHFLSACYHDQKIIKYVLCMRQMR